jgi:pyruvate dehydrogenase E2 component (dihydrolipoamide acetyltransferase)
MANLTAFTMPKWGIEMSEGTVAEWMVEEGARFERGTVLTLIETDKITNEIEAETEGCFVRLIARAGETHPVGALLAVLGDPGADPAAIEAFVGSFRAADTSFGDSDDAEPAAPLPAEVTKPAPDSRMISPAAYAAASEAGVDIASITGTGRGGRISLQDVHQATRQAPTISLNGPFELTQPAGSFASPMARRLAAMHGVDLTGLTGTGPRGRICKADVLAAAALAPAAMLKVVGEIVVEPMSKMRRTIARRLTLSKSTIPHFYVRQRVRADRLMVLRAAADPRPSLNDYLIRACALALRQVPALNIQVHGDDIHRLPGADIAVAVATDGGLITPIVAAAEQRGVAEIAAVMRDLGTRARAGRLKQEEFEGGSFSLSNLGMFGVEQFDAIINPPHGAILAVGAARPEPIADDGAIRIVPMLHLSLSCDHRAIDGADAGRFMMALVALIEAPEAL